MSSPIRFLVLIVLGWVGVRATTLFLSPEGALAAPGEGPVLPPPPATQLAPPGLGWPVPATPELPSALAMPAAMPMPYAQAWPFPIPVYQPAAAPVRYVEARSSPVWDLPPPRGYPAAQSLGPATAATWPEIGASVARQSTPAVMPAGPAAGPPRFDRFQVAAWAMMRDRPGPQSLAGTGTLGGSQAGMRFLYRFNNRLAASLRATAPLGTARRGGDVGVGVRYVPFSNIPVAVTLERRQGFGVMGGPSGFALFAEGGVTRSMGRYRLDSYLQAGMIVGKDGRLGFVDGAAVVTRPVWRNISVGGGVWGAKQPGLARLDVGPRISLPVVRGIRAHADYRVKAAGNALPGSGAVVTIAGDF